MTAPAKFDAGRQHRRALIAKVHIGKKELGLADDVYRAALKEATGRESAGDCTEAELVKVLDHFKARGWTPGVVKGGKPAGAARSRVADHPSAKKARALWISLHQLGVVREASEGALEAFARRQLKVERLQWADQAQVYKLIEALKAMGEREGWKQDLAGVDPAWHVRTLKRRLVEAQCAKLGRFIGARDMQAQYSASAEQLDAMARELAHEIWSRSDG